MSNASGDDKKKRLPLNLKYASVPYMPGALATFFQLPGEVGSEMSQTGSQHEYDQLARNRIHNDGYPAQWPLLPWDWVSFQGSAEPWVSRTQQPASSLLTLAALPARLGASWGLKPVLDWQMFNNGHLENLEILTLICSVYPFPWWNIPTTVISSHWYRVTEHGVSGKSPTITHHDAAFPPYAWSRQQPPQEQKEQWSRVKD